MRFANPISNIQKFKLNEGMNVADFGAGPGAYTFPVAEYVGVTGKVYAIDIQQDLVLRIRNLARQAGYKNVEAIWGDIELHQGTTLPDESMNRIIISNVLFLTTRKREVVQEAFRIVKPGGKVLYIDWKDSFGGIGPKKEAIIAPKDAKALFMEEGFVVDDEIDPGAHHYGIIFKKV